MKGVGRELCVGGIHDYVRVVGGACTVVRGVKCELFVGSGIVKGVGQC